MFCAGIAALGLALLAPVAAFAEDPDDPALEQSLTAGQQVVRGERVLETGHVDMGPKFVDGRWTFLIHDDAARADANAVSVWRYPDETVLRVLDQARLTVPDDPGYAFTGAEPGQDVWVVPQTQNPEAVWVGWNTQEPQTMQAIDRGVTLRLTGVRGPGIMTAYLQSGSFGEPQLLWDSRLDQAQPIWVDVNTHTHANWVFTEPGVYLVRLEAAADLIDGSQVSDTQVIRFAVGTNSNVAEAFAAVWDTPATAEPETGGAENSTQAQEPVPDSGSDPLVPVLIGAIALVATGLAVGAVTVAVRGSRAKRRALALNAAKSEPQPGGLGAEDQR
jgi:putative ABC transporter-associated repeat protein